MTRRQAGIAAGAAMTVEVSTPVYLAMPSTSWARNNALLGLENEDIGDGGSSVRVLEVAERVRVPKSVKLTVPRKLDAWATAMTRVFQELHRILKPRGHVAFEVGEVHGGRISFGHVSSGVPLVGSNRLNSLFIGGGVSFSAASFSIAARDAASNRRCRNARNLVFSGWNKTRSVFRHDIQTKGGS